MADILADIQSWEQQGSSPQKPGASVLDAIDSWESGETYKSVIDEPYIAAKPPAYTRPLNPEELTRIQYPRATSRMPPEKVVQFGQIQDQMDVVSTGDKIINAVQAAGKGAAKVASALPKDLALVADVVNRVLPKSMQRDVPIEESFFYEIGKGIDSLAEDLLPMADPRQSNSVLSQQLPEAAGTMAGFVGGGVAGRLAKLGKWAVTAVLGAGVEAASVFEEAKAHGASDTDALKAAGWAAPIGMSEALPLGRILDRFGGAKGLRKVVTDAIKGAIEEGAQEFGQTVGENIVASAYYDKGRDPLEGTGTAAGIGGLLGLMTGLGVGYLGHRLNKTRPSPEASPGPTPAPQRRFTREALLTTEGARAFAQAMPEAAAQFSEKAPSRKEIGRYLARGETSTVRDRQRISQLLRENQNDKSIPEVAQEPVPSERTPDPVAAEQAKRPPEEEITQAQESVAETTTVPDGPAQPTPLSEISNEVRQTEARQEEGQEGQRQQDVLTPPPAEPAPQGRASPEPSGKAIGLSVAEQNALRQHTGLIELPEADQRSWASVLDRAKRDGYDQRAVEIAETAAKSGGQISDVEHAGMVLRAAQLANEYDASVNTQAELINQGDTDAARLEQARSATILDQIDKLTEGARLARREVARALSIGRMMINRETFELADIVRRATAAKGQQLTNEELTRFHELAEQHKKLQQQLTEAEARHQQEIAEKDRQLAERMAQRETKKAANRTRATAAREKIRTERQEIKNQLAALGLRINDITGVGPEASYLIGRLAISYIKEGAVTLDEVVRNVLADVPSITERDVWQSLNALNPKKKKKAKDEIVKRIAALKVQAKLLDETADAVDGVFKPKTPIIQENTADPNPLIRKTLKGIRRLALRSGIKPNNLKRTLDAIAAVEAQLAGGPKAPKKRQLPATGELASAKEKLNDLKKILREQEAFKRLADKLDRAERGEFDPPKSRKEPTEQVKAMRRRIAELKNAPQKAAKEQAEIDRLEALVREAESGRFPKQPKREAKTPRVVPARIRELRKKLTDLRNAAYRSGTHPDLLENAVRRINEIQDQLDSGWRKVRKNLLAVPPELASAREKIQSLLREMRVNDQIVDLQDQLATGNYKVAPKPDPTPLSPDMERKQIELRHLRRKIRQAVRDMEPMTTKKAIAEGMNTLRTLKATADMSSTLRQALVLSARRPLTAARSFAKSARAFFSQYTTDQIDNAIRAAPHHYLREKAGLYLSPLDSPNVNQREEAFMARYIERVPVIGEVIKASERHMITHLNLMRVAAFDQFLESNPNATQEELKAWANYVNVASGRGDLGRAAAFGTELATVIFAPRFAVSRFQAPYMLLKHMKHPRVRKEIAKDMAAFVGLGTTALALAGLAGAAVGYDPRDPDFGKIVLGNTRVDIWAGFQQPARLVTRLALGITDRTGITGSDLLKEEKEFDPLEMVGRFAAFKLAPSITLPVELARGKTAVGEDRTPLQSIAGTLLPLMVEDTIDAYRNDGFGAAAGTGLGTFFGLGINTYDNSERKAKVEARRRRANLVKDFRASIRESGEADAYRTLEEQMAAGSVEPDEAKKLFAEARLSPTAASIKRMPAGDALKSYAELPDADKTDVAPVIKDKLEAAIAQSPNDAENLMSESFRLGVIGSVESAELRMKLIKKHRNVASSQKPRGKGMTPEERSIAEALWRQQQASSRRWLESRGLDKQDARLAEFARLRGIIKQND